MSKPFATFTLDVSVSGAPDPDAEPYSFGRLVDLIEEALDTAARAAENRINEAGNFSAKIEVK